MDSDFKDCINKRRLAQFKADAGIIEKELGGAEFDLQTAKKSLNDGNSKWATVQAYYSLFHSAKALVYKAGYREKSHQCLFVAIKAIYVNSGKLEGSLLQSAKDIMVLREDADYGLIYSDKSAEEAVRIAGAFFLRASELIKKGCL